MLEVLQRGQQKEQKKRKNLHKKDAWLAIECASGFY